MTTAGPFWPPATRKVSPFQNNIPLFFYLYFALPPAIQLHLPNASSLNTCATVIRYSSTLSLTLALEGVGDQLHAPAALPPGKTR